MATFKVGQRVRIINAAPDSMGAHLLGCEATIEQARWHGYEFGVQVIGNRSPAHDGLWGANSRHLAPLTDPKADAFLESIRKMKPYSEPTVSPREAAIVQLGADFIRAYYERRKR